MQLLVATTFTCFSLYGRRPQWLSALSVNLFTTLQLVTLFTVFSSVASHLYPYLFSYELRSFYTAVYVFLPEQLREVLGL